MMHGAAMPAPHPRPAIGRLIRRPRLADAALAVEDTGVAWIAATPPLRGTAIERP
jgi:hypothetical protein